MKLFHSGGTEKFRLNLKHNFVQKKTNIGVGLSLDNVGGPVFGLLRPDYPTSSINRNRTLTILEGELDTTQPWSENDAVNSEKNIRKREDGKS